MNETIYYPEIERDLSEAALAALVDISEGVHPYCFGEWMWWSLRDRGLIMGTHRELMDAYDKDGNCLTNRGRAFVAWYRSPRDKPQQLSLL